MTNVSELMTSAQAAEYISAKLPRPWKDPVSTLGRHVQMGHISPVDMPGDSDLRRAAKRYFTQAECDRFVSSLRGQGNQFTDLSPIIDRLGVEPDDTLAKEAGVSVRTIKRARQRLGK